MAFLGKGKKQDMLQLAEELGINATLNMTVPSIKIAITNSEGYEEEFVKNLYETIIANGKDGRRYVRQFVSFDQCQRAGKPNDKKKAPLKLVPVIQEVFTKLNIDACGPLPITSKGNRYLITAICMSSKFPEAIPVSDISSVSVTDALLNIFSRMGFPVKYNVTRRYGTVSHESTGGIHRQSWCMGKNLRTPETLVMEHWMEPEEEGDLVTEYMFKLINRLKDVK
ncbi:transposon Ty3-G Gag-Pol polyprotein [Trichonephila clavipes]|nr:transposon Ty3-G Gag-Pol polyprotein [Trichonephila clavipes]